MILAAYGIRKAYKKQQARKASKLQEKESQDTAASLSDELRSASSSSSYTHSPVSHPHPVNGGLVNYPVSPSSPSPSSRTAYSASVHSQRSFKDPLEEMRSYQAYIQRQSRDFGTDLDPPTYELAIGQEAETTQYPWQSPFSLPSRTENQNHIKESRHIPEGRDRLVELSSSSESSRSSTQRVPLRLFHPRSPVPTDDQVFTPATELPADYPNNILSPTLDDQLQESLDELFAEVPAPLRIKKSEETERFELPANEIDRTSAPAADQVGDQPTDSERLQLKRPRSDSGSGVESDENEEVIVRFRVVDRTKRPFPRRATGSFGR